jgi:DNA-binding MarR family transcriptional regulator
VIPKRRLPDLEERAMLEILRTQEFLQQRLAEFFKQFQLTPTQYNILRILRGAGKDGLTCSQAADRMISADPDITRLLDRLDSRGLSQRVRSREDRRAVITRITAEGLELIKAIDKPLGEFLKRHISPVGKTTLQELIRILESIRKT